FFTHDIVAPDEALLEIMAQIGTQLGQVAERERSDAGLRESEEQYRNLFDNSPAGIYRSRQDGTIAMANPSFLRMLGYATLAELAASDTLSAFLRHRRNGVLEWTGVCSEAAWVKKDGTEILVRDTVRCVRGENTTLFYEGIVEDITRRKRTELLELNRNKVLETIGAGRSLDEILKALVHLVENHRPGAMCAVSLLRDGRLYLAAAPHLPESYRRSIANEEIGPTAGSCGSTAYWGKTVIVADIESDPLWDSLRDVALAHSLRACWSSPIFSAAGEILGTVSMFFPGPCAAEIDDHNLLDAAVRLASMGIEHRQLCEQLSHQARHDALTGLPNRILFEDRLEQALNHARRRGNRVAVLYLDIDRFKQINDTMGHRIGDLFLQQVSGRLCDCVRECDALARMGGDEFNVVLTELEGQQSAEGAARRILEAMNVPFQIDGHELFSSVSIGISIFPENGNDSATLQKNADTAMYCAKSQGKNRYQYFAREMSEAGIEALAMESHLRRALDQGHFEIHYQPQAKLNGELTGLEALLRLNHPKLGMLLPGQFISVAEQSGLIVPIGAWVLREACAQMVAWEREGYVPLKIAVNVSAVQFTQPNFSDTVANVLSETGLDPGLLELELTETLIGNFKEAKRQMQALRKLGVGLAVDDFGTGYSSLSYLHQLPIHTVKIDQSFVREIGMNGTGLPVVEGIIALARSLGFDVIAEGVETQQQHNALRDAGCDIAQGYLISKPLPVRELELFLTRRGNLLSRIEDHREIGIEEFANRR
ncbi:MAG: EAL domain-containing protein, partial [Acidobacteriota bacterium]|nr:EAL domain-containing protein [Acidobacteriota bacterium]